MAMNDRKDFACVLCCHPAVRIKNELLGIGRQIAAGPIAFLPTHDDKQPTGFAWVFRLRVLYCCSPPTHEI